MKLRLLAATLAVAALGACAESTTSSVDSSLDPGARGPSLVVGPDSTLSSYTFTGPNKVLSPGYAKYRVRDIVGGVGPYRFYWFVERCLVGNTSCNSPTLVDYGTGLDSVRVYVGNDLNNIYVSVQIDDLNSTVSDGETLPTLAPGAFDHTSGTSFCGTPTYYPHPEVKQVGGVPTTRYYARNTCNGGRIYDPTGTYTWPYGP